MNRAKTSSHLTLIGVLLLVSGSVQAQQTADTVGSLAGIEITTSVDRAEMYVGDLVAYTLTITYDSTYELIPPPVGANLGAFDVKDYQTDIRTTLEDGRVRSRTTFALSTFTTGNYMIPPIPVAFLLPDSSRKVLLSESVPLKVASLLAEGADTLDIRPLKAQYEFPPNLTRYYLWGGAGALVLAGILLLIWWLRRRRRRAAEPIDLRSPWEIAFERLALLKQQNLPEQERYKEYYSELTELVRDYVGRMYTMNVLDMTTEEFLRRFMLQELPGGLHEDISRFLRHADLVKFAKYAPAPERADADFEYVHRMIEQVRADYLRRQEAAGVAVSSSTASSLIKEQRDNSP